MWLASAHHLQMMHEGYDRLAFMGDAVAGKSISDLLLNDYYCIAGVMGVHWPCSSGNILPKITDTSI